jgi:outer membrane protein assembly factor BamE (lipoprotein component of BamABCDE complex)
MHYCRRALAPLALIALLAGCANAPSSSAPAGAGAGPTAAAADDHPERGLKKGMTAAQVRQIMGAPAEINPRPSPTGKAEAWVYHRTFIGPPQQLQVGTKPISVMVQDADGVYRSHVIQEEPIYRQAHDKTTETIHLLMFDGQLVEQATTAQKQQEFE